MPNVLLTFEDLHAGDIVNNQYQGDGVTISTAGHKPPMVFDTDHPTGGDWDLATSNLGNVLIISEDGDSHDPDDNAGGGTFVFDFDQPTEVLNFRALDTEEGGTVRLFDEHGTLIKTVHISHTADNGQTTVHINADDVARMEVTLNGSGAIDNICYCTPEPTPELDGIVDGSAGDDVIDAAYTADPEGDRIDNNDAILPGEAANDDIVDALGGNDQVVAGVGDDDIYAGSGNDTVYGNAGHDIIYGDSNYDGSSGGGADVRESLNWSENTGDITGFTQNTGSVDVTFSVLTQEGDSFTEFEADQQQVGGIQSGSETMNDNSSLYSETSGQGQDTSYRLDFSTPVENVSFRVNDIDGDGIVTVRAYDAEGNLITVNLSGGSNLTLSDTDGVAGDDTADSNGGYAPDTNATYSLLVDIPGPVSRIEIDHGQNGPNNSGVNVTDIFYDVPAVDSGADGNDQLFGGSGADIIFGEGGDDVLGGGAGDDQLTGGSGADEISGGDDRDTIIGGNDGDVVDGGTGGVDYDILDLTGEGPFRVVGETADADGDSTSGTVEFLDTDGNVTGSLSFAEIEEILGDRVNQGPDAVDDTSTTDEDTSVNIAVLENDTDPENDNLTVISASADNGSVVINADGTITYTPDPDFNGEDTITYTIEDEAGNTDTAEVLVTVESVNDGPDAVDDEASTNNMTPVDIVVLDNDSDPDGDPLTVTSAIADSGDVVINPDGTITYTPEAGFGGVATITYTIEDGNGGTDTATVSVSVNDGIVEGTAGDDLIDVNYVGDPEGDMIDNNDEFLPGEGPQDDIVLAGDGNDTVLAGEGDDEVFGEGGNDTLFGEDGDDDLSGGAGNDTIDGGLGNDTVTGGDGEDNIQGGDGDDRLFGGRDDDVIDGGVGDDLIEGDQGEDILTGGEGNDSIWGGNQNDTIDGGAGDDDIGGGRGNDIITAGDGNDIVEGNDGNDVIDTSGSSPLPDLGYPGLFPADTDPNDDIDFVDGGAGDDIISTGDDRDTIIGGLGNDIIDGGVDNDTIDGGEGNDRIVGGEGADTIDGGAGDDTIYAGIDPDLGLPDNLDIADVDGDLVTNNGTDTVHGGDGNDIIFGADDDDTLFGDAGNDFIDGGVDDDTIDGGTGDDIIIGGQGADTQSGGDDADTFLVGSAEDGVGDVIDGGTGGNDNDTLDLTGSGPLRIINQTVDADGDSTSGTVEFLDGVGGAVIGTLDFTEIENIVPCFTPGTSIATPRGEVLVEELTVGDKIITRDNGIQELRWIGAKRMDGRLLQANPHLQPVLIKEGSLGHGLPERDMLVSPNHRMLVNNERVALYFEENEVLVSAKHLVNPGEGVQSINSMGTTYIHFMFENHEVVLANGAWTESFQPGDYSLKGVGNAQRNEIFELFPELEGQAGREAYASARLTLKKHEARMLFQ